MRRARWRTADLRVLLIGVVFLASWVGIGYRLWAVQWVNAAEYAAVSYTHLTLPTN